MIVARTFRSLILLCLAVASGLLSVPNTGSAQEPAASATVLTTVKALLPLEDLAKNSPDQLSRYLILPLSHFENLKKAKEAWLASAAQPLPERPPLAVRALSTHIEGRLEGQFVRLCGVFKAELLDDDWHTLNLLKGPLAIEQVTLDGLPWHLESRPITNSSRSFQMAGDRERMALSGFELARKGDLLRQQHWMDNEFALSCRGKGRHQISVTFLVPVDETDGVFRFDFGVPPVPLTFFRFVLPEYEPAVEETGFKDYRVDPDTGKGSVFYGWLGASTAVRLVWRPKTPVAPRETPDTVPPENHEIASSSEQPSPVPVPVKPPPVPLVYSRSETLITIGETTLQGRLDLEYSITKAPVSSFTILMPDTVDVLQVQSDRPESHQIVAGGGFKRLIVDFQAGREESCPLSILFEARMDNAIGTFSIPDVYPVNVERDLGTLAVQALTSVEVLPVEDLHAKEGVGQNLSGASRIDPLELPDSLKKRAARPILLAYRLGGRPLGLGLHVKRYADFPQQTVVADQMDVMTTFTTNESSQTQVTLRIRNNNKQYLMLQLATGAEILGTFRNGQAIKPVAGRSDGRVQVPLLMSQEMGVPETMVLKILTKQAVASMSWMGTMNLEPPLLDIPVSRMSWTLFAPTQYSLFNFQGTVQSNLLKQDPFFFRGFLGAFELVKRLVLNPGAILVLCIGLVVALLVISRAFIFRVAANAWDLAERVFRALFVERAVSLVSLMVVLAIIGFLAAIATPNFRKAREQSREKACYANMRVLLGAVEMYNMDHSTMMTKLDTETLLKGQYLKTSIQFPEVNCRYSALGDLTGVGVITCDVHGPVEMTSGLFDQLRAGAPSDERAAGRAGASGSPLPQARGRGTLPIEAKFVTTNNHYGLERDLVLADILPERGLAANSTCPKVEFTYLRWEVVIISKILAFTLALVAGFFFINGSFFRLTFKIIVSVLILAFLSAWDDLFQFVGEHANMGLWIALLGGVAWKVIWFISENNWSPGFSEPPGSPRPPSSPGDSQPSSQQTSHLPAPSARDGRAPLPGIFLALLFTLLAAMAMAGPPSPREIRLMVPFRDLTSLGGTESGSVIVPEDDYRYLIDVGSAPTPAPSLPPMEYCLRSAFFSARVGEEGVRCEATFTIDLFRDGWKKVYLLPGEIVPSEVTLNGKPTSLDLFRAIDGNAIYGLILEATGSIEVGARFFLPLSSGVAKTRRFTLPMVPTPQTRLRVETPDPDCEGWVDPGMFTLTESGPRGSSFEAMLPPCSEVNVELSPRFARTVPTQVATSTGAVATGTQPVVVREETRVVVQERNLVSLEEGFARCVNKYELLIRGTEGIDRFSLRVPPGVRVMKAESVVLGEWTEERTETKYGILHLNFKSKLKGEVACTVTFEFDWKNDEKDLVVPELVPMMVDRSFGLLAVGCLPFLELAVADTPVGYEPIDAGEFVRQVGGQVPEKLPFAFKFLSHPNKLLMKVSRPRDIDQVTALIDKAEAMTLINEDGYIITRIGYEVRNNSEQFLKIALPAVGSATPEFWSSEVGGVAVKSGLDTEHGWYNVPILRSPIVASEPQAFPVEIVYATNLKTPLGSFRPLHLELPRVHLGVEELSWVVHLPEGCELMLMKGRSNVDPTVGKPAQPLLDGSRSFSRLDLGSLINVKSPGSFAGVGGNASMRGAVGALGLLPVKFSIPTTTWWSGFTMLQIDPGKTPPYIEGALVNTKRGSGRWFQALMILLGGIAGVGTLLMLSGRRPLMWFLILAFLGSGLAVAVMLKLYQSDHSFKMGFSAAIFLCCLHLLYRWDPRKGAPPAGK